MTGSCRRALDPFIWLTDRCEQVVARLLAAAADSGADAAVLVVLGVPLTLVATGATGRGAGLDHRAEDTDIGRGLTGEDAARSVAGVGAIEVEANAAHQLLYPLLAEIGVGGTGAAGGTLETLIDAAQERISVDARWSWMGLDHLANDHFRSLLVRGRHHRAVPVAAAWQGQDQLVASTAERITLVTSPGRVMGVRWPALTLEM
jgi:hypothetical protein